MALRSLVFLLAITILLPDVAAAQVPALDGLRRAARRRRSGPDERRTYAVALLRAGRFTEAEREFKAVARLRRRAPEAQLEVAEAVFAAGNFRAARRACRTLERDTERDSVWSRVCRAQAFLVAHRSTRAFEELEVAIELQPDLYAAHLALGEAHRYRAAVDEGLAAYRRAAELRPDAAAPNLGIGQLYAAVGRSDESVAALRRAIELEPTWPAVQFELGRQLTGPEALSLLQNAVEGRPGWAEAEAALGQALYAAGDYGPARAALDRAIALDSENAPAHSALARTLFAQNDLPAAEASARRAIELVRNDARMTQLIGDIEARTDRQEEALETYRSAADMSPRDPAPLLAGARLAYSLHRNLLAAAYLDRALDINERDAQALELYGDVMLARRNRARAAAYWNDAIAGEGEVDRDAIRAKIAQLE